MVEWVYILKKRKYLMNLICSRCNKEFNHHRRRTNCLDCVPSRNTYSSEEERIISRRKQLVNNVKRRRSKIKEMSIEYKGNKCQICGYDKCSSALEFHHLDASKKDFSIGEKGYTRSWEKVKQELDKCIMVCANCHREIHSEL